MTEANIQQDTDFFCSIEARGQADQLMGSAPKSQVWFLLEYSAKWGSKAFEESAIYAQLSTFQDKLVQIENSRLLLIKQDRPSVAPYSFYAALSAHSDPVLLHFELADYAELNDLDLQAMLNKPESFPNQIVQEPIYLVCTNGLRDKCCARNGMPVYQALKNELGGRVWQSSHHGGHRFSANLLKMPAGLSYGQLDLGDPIAIIEDMEAGYVPLQHLRGRSTLPAEGQAAEALLMETTGQNIEGAFAFESVEPINNTDWRAAFIEIETGVQLQIEFHRQERENFLLVSCIGGKQVPQVEYTLKSISTSNEKEKA